MPETKRKKRTTIPANLIAPCGMNCRLCLGYVREKNRCPGCRLKNTQGSEKAEYRNRCRIKNCDQIASGKLRHCSGECLKFPCTRLRQLDKRYRTNYGMSMIENLTMIDEAGIRNFIQKEKAKWICPECGEMLSVHRPACLSCGQKWR